MCKKQTSVSHSSTESEIVSLDAGLRMDDLLTSRPLGHCDWSVTFHNQHCKTKQTRPRRLCANQTINLNDHSQRSRNYVDFVPTNTHSPSQLYIFWRQGKIQGEVKDTCQSCACSTENEFESVQQDEFLDVLFSHFGNFLSDPIEKQIMWEVKKRLPVKVQRWQSQDQRSQRRHSTWCHAARGARREIRRKTWDIQWWRTMWSCRHKEIWADHSINPETESSQATGKSSKFSFLETVRSEGIFKLFAHGDCGQQPQDQSFKTGNTRTIGTWRRSSISYKRIWELQKTFSMEASRQMCVHMENVHVFVNESSHAYLTELLGEHGVLQEHELRGMSELIQYHTEIDVGARLRVHLLHGRD